jgi:predicted transcriptional regulator YheO
VTTMTRKGTNTTLLEQRWGPVLDCIADLFGPNAEVVLHDAHHPDRSVVMIRNGHITGRAVGAPLTDLGFFMLRESAKRIDTLGVYYSRTASGDQLKCNAANLRDEQGNIEGILCINVKVHDEPVASSRVNGNGLVEHYWTEPAKVIEDMVADACQKAGNHAGSLSREQKLELIRAMDARGVFLARSAVAKVSSAFGIATPTVYKYVRIVRSSRKQKHAETSVKSHA